MSNEESERITTSQDVISRLHDKIDEQQAEAMSLADECEESATHWVHEIDTRFKAAKMLRAQHARIAELEADNASLRGINSAQDKALAELEGQLEAIGAGGVEPLRKQAAAAPQAAQGMDMVNCKSGNWLTVVYRDIRPGDEARTIGEHPKVSALSWSHALNDRDAALAAQAKQGGAA